MAHSLAGPAAQFRLLPRGRDYPELVLTECQDLTDRQADEVLGLVAQIDARTGRSPVNEEGRLWIARGGTGPGVRHWLVREDSHDLRRSAGPLRSYAYLRPRPDGSSTDAEVAATTVGDAEQLLAAIMGSHAEGVRLWVHGRQDPAAPVTDALANAGKVVLLRDLHLLQAPLTPIAEHGPDVPDPASAPPPLPDGVTLRAFKPGEDEAGWLEINRAAFTELPDQANWTSEDLRARMSEPWFSAEDLIVAERTDGSELLGFHWTKVLPAPADSDASPTGEVYVLAVAPWAQGIGLGRVLTVAGMQHLAERGCEAVNLFVDATNGPALTLYWSLGFEDLDRDLQYEVTD